MTTAVEPVDSTAIERRAFQAETTQLLHLMIHALYTNKEIFLRELISNASDALDRLHFEALQDTSLLDGSAPAQIRIEPDPAARTLTIHDAGIGMSREEMVTNLGTIARSGTRALLEQAAHSGGAPLPDLIGRFGVGFYSAFMVADEVTVVSRRAGESTATRWTSTGDGYFTVGDSSRASAGTSITLHLKAVNADLGLEDYTDRWVLTRIVKRYSDFVAHPIVLVVPAGVPEPGGFEVDAVSAGGEQVINSQKPIWAKPAAEVDEQKYVDFYKSLSGDWHPPMLRLSVKAEGRWEYEALLFVPSQAPQSLFYHGHTGGLRLCARRVVVMDECADLLPRYLRFVKGVVDTMDLPLNISRQMLQENRHVADIRKHLTKKILDRLQDLFTNEPARYLQFWQAFGRALKEGVSQDYDNRSRLLDILLFASSHDPVQLTTLRDYVQRMPPDQPEMYFLTGESRDALEHSPHAEAIRAHGYEILYFTDPVDELLTDVLPEFDGRKLRALAKGALDGQAAGVDASPDQAAAFADLLPRLEERFRDHVRQVRLSTRLTASPACLISETYEHSPFMERLLLKGKGGGPRQRRTLELNATHPIVLAMRDRVAHPDMPGPSWETCADLIFGCASLSEGSDLADPVAFTRGLVDVLARAVEHPPAAASLEGELEGGRHELG